METFKHIKVDGRLNRNEIQEVASYTQEKIKVLLGTKDDFKEFINTEYKSANENYLGGVEGIKRLQRALGFKGKDGVDGFFGKDTFFALVNFQRKHGLVTDGLAGPKTQKEVFKTNNILISYFKNKRIKKVLSRSLAVEEGKNSVEEGKNSLKNNNTLSFSKKIYSLPAEKKGNMTYCSRTARKNLYRLGLSTNEVPHGSSALDSMKLYNSERYDKISDIPQNSNVLDLFIDTKSRYEHRAAAYLKGGEWVVLDPYFGNSTSPIPISKYLSTKKILGIYPHTSKKNA